MQVILQKIYFVFAISYIVYFFFTVNKYKYNILTEKIKNTSIAVFIMIIAIICFLLFYGIKKKFIYTNEEKWVPYDINTHYGHIGKKKKELFLQEAMHKTYKWREDFNIFLKLLQSPKTLSIEKAREFVAFLYGSNFVSVDNKVNSNNTGIKDELLEIIGLLPNGLNDPDNSDKNISDEKKNKLIGILLDEIYGVNSFTNNLIPTKDGMDYFKDLKKNLPKKVIIDRLKYFIEGVKESKGTEDINEIDIPIFDTVFTALGGRNVYTKELSEFGKVLRGGANPNLRPAPENRVLIIGSDGAEEGDDPEYIENLNMQSTVSAIGADDVRGRPLGPVGPLQTGESEREESGNVPPILQKPKPEFWGYGVTQNSLYTGKPLQKPLQKALDTIKKWIPVIYEFYDKQIHDKYIESYGGGIGAVQQDKYSPGTIISSRGAGFLNVDKDEGDGSQLKRTLNSVVTNKFISSTLNVNENESKYNNLNKIVNILISIIKEIDDNSNIEKKIVLIIRQLERIITEKSLTEEEKNLLVYIFYKYFGLEKPEPERPESPSELYVLLFNIFLFDGGESLKLPRTGSPEDTISNNHLINYFRNILNHVRVEYDDFLKPGNGYSNYPSWLRSNSLIKLKTHRDIAENIKITYLSREEFMNDEMFKDMFAADEIMGDNKEGAPPKGKDKITYLSEKLNLYNVPLRPPIDFELIGGSLKVKSGGAEVPDESDVEKAIRLGILPSNIISKHWLKEIDINNNLKFDDVKEDINIDSLNVDPGEVSIGNKQKYSSTNYEYNEKIGNSIHYDYYEEFLKFIVYFGNYNTIILIKI